MGSRLAFPRELTKDWPRSMSIFAPFRLLLVSIFAAACVGPSVACAASPTGGLGAGLFARTNLAAWCIVPFDSKKRDPEARAAMLERLGLAHFVYDYRAEHIPTFDAEVEALDLHHIDLLGWWFPSTLNDEARLILDVIQRHRVHPQLWVMGGGGPTASADEQRSRISAEAGRIKPIAEAAAKAGCAVGLYNHGAWFGVPENQIAIIERLKSMGATNVGMVYNQHHGHADIDRFAEVMREIKPYLMAVNLNGMVRDGDKHGLEILPIGEGDQDLRLLKIIRDSGWSGPVGILNHTDEDAEARLLDNLDGLAWVAAQLDGQPPGPRPALRSRRDAQPGQGPPKPRAAVSASVDYWAVEDPKEREKLPLYQVIPAAKPDELTPANGLPRRNSFRAWSRSHGDSGSARFSALDEINRGNVAKLKVAWTYHSKDGTGNLQCNPIMAAGMVFGPTPGKHMVAIDAATGVEVWRFKPEGRPAFRGLIYWAGRDGVEPRVLFCSGPYLYALDPKTGRPVPGFGEGGRAKLPGRSVGDFGAATAAPAIFERTVIVPGWEKDVWAFDVVTGKQRWTFHTVPHEGEYGYDTWDKTEAYGANCWGGMALDEARGIAYITTGSAKENFIGVTHRGDNLFANCVIALDARDGKRLWHFQEVRHDIWDLDIPAPPNLLSITRDGRKVDVVAAVSKIGNTLLLDRLTGKPVFPFRLRRAPVSDLPGEQTSPYQPDLELPEPFAKQEFSQADVTDRSEEAEAQISSRVKSATTGWFRPFSEGKLNLYFGLHGGAEWTGSCVDPETGRLYVSANHIPWIISVFRDDDPPDDPKSPKTPGQLVFEKACAACHGLDRVGAGTCPPLRGLRHRMNAEAIHALLRSGRNSMPAQPDMSEADIQSLADYLLLRDRPLPPEPAKPERPRYSFNGYPKFLDQDGYPGNKPPWGEMVCVDLNTGKIAWRVPLGEHEALTAQGVKKTGTENFGGAIVTAGGLVFCAGTRDSKIRAFDKETGAELWAARLPWVGSAPPATYEIGGRQYLIVAACGGGKLGTPTGDAYVAYSLP
jgi:quinoprotein glucose dehydrogenase